MATRLNGNNVHFPIGYVTLVAITGTTDMVSNQSLGQVTATNLKIGHMQI